MNVRKCVDIATATPPSGVEELLSLGRPLRVKLGIDPTSPNIHLGFALVLRALEAFANEGHECTVIMGDATARIGDPTGRSKTRQPMGSQEIETNIESLLAQMGQVIDMSKVTVRRNMEWLHGLNFLNMMELMGSATLNQLMRRHDFRDRWDMDNPISMHELMYPLIQAFDSFTLRTDIELGGQDQLFNVMMGRTMQEHFDREERQVALLFPILRGLDGVRKMSKSFSNTIGIAESANDIFAKTMSIPDALIDEWADLCIPDVGAERLNSEFPHPMEAKLQMASMIVDGLKGSSAGTRARDQWEQIHSKRELPTEIPVFALKESQLWEGGILINRLLFTAKVVKSLSEARRVVEQGGVKHNGVKVAVGTIVPSSQLDGSVFQIGPRRFVKVSLEQD